MKKKQPFLTDEERKAITLYRNKRAVYCSERTYGNFMIEKPSNKETPHTYYRISQKVKDIVKGIIGEEAYNEVENYCDFDSTCIGPDPNLKRHRQSVVNSIINKALVAKGIAPDTLRYF